MRAKTSLARRAPKTRGGRPFAVSRAACAVALLLSLAVAALFCGVYRAGAQSRKSTAQDVSARDSKAKDKNDKAKDAKDSDERGAKDDARGADEDARRAGDDARDADDKDATRTPLLIMPAMPVNLAPSAQGKSAQASVSAPATATQRGGAATAQGTSTTQTQGAPATQSNPATPQDKIAPSSQSGGAKTSTTALSVSPVSVTVVSFGQLAKRSALAQTDGGPAPLIAIHAPLTIPDSHATAAAPKRPKPTSSSAPPAQDDATGGPSAPSPAPSQSFLAQEDGPKAGNLSGGVIPPDTQGAVGLDKVFVNTNQNYRVEDKTTGAPLSTVSIDSFWSSSGGTGFFDPRITFDPYNQRWILVADSNSVTSGSSIEIAVSQTADPQGSYNVYRFVVGCAPLSVGCSTQGEWADFPMLGFNKNWLAVSMNMFEINGSGQGGAQNFVEGRVLVLDYPQARTGAITSGHATLFAGASIGFCLHPVETYDPTQNTLYLPQHIESDTAAYDLANITGTPGSPALNLDPTLATGGRTRPGGAWVQPSGDILPQTCTGTPGVTCPTTLRFIDVGDAFIRGNAVFRNNHIYYTQTVGLPAGTMTHTATQWTKLNTDGTFADGGRIEDPTATGSNGGKWYAYSSIAVNHNDDFLIGFSQFSSAQFASAAYAYHDHTDAAGTTRDPLVFKAGEDYYAKDFGAGRNRWGDYSHTVVDPFNDTDIWTIQEYAQQRVLQDSSTLSNNSRWGTWWAKLSVANAGEPGGLVISEFRLRGPGGPQDEYVEIYNASGSDITVQAGDGSQGYGLFASDGTLRFMIPNGTLIPARGHYLGVNTGGYSLSNYPAGSSSTATGDATYTTDIADNAGIALFNTTDQTHLLAAARFDAVGSNVEGNTLFKEGGGYPAVAALNPGPQYAFVRDMCGKGGSTGTGGRCPADGLPEDTGNNAADFFFVDTDGTDIGAGARLGAPGPENSHSPVKRSDTAIPVTLLDPATGSSAAPNRARDATPNTPNSTVAPFGTLSLRRTVTNNTGQAITRLRFRVIDLSTFDAPAGTADLRVITSGASPVTVAITGSNPACPSNNCAVQQTTLEEPPAQSGVAGGGFNSTLAVNAVGPGPSAPASSDVSLALGSPIPPGGSINVQLTLGVRQPGNFRIFVNVEAETAAP